MWRARPESGPHPSRKPREPAAAATPAHRRTPTRGTRRATPRNHARNRTTRPSARGAYAHTLYFLERDTRRARSPGPRPALGVPHPTHSIYFTHDTHTQEQEYHQCAVLSCGCAVRKHRTVHRRSSAKSAARCSHHDTLCSHPSRLTRKHLITHGSHGLLMASARTTHTYIAHTLARERLTRRRSSSVRALAP